MAVSTLDNRYNKDAITIVFSCDRKKCLKQYQEDIRIDDNGIDTRSIKPPTGWVRIRITLSDGSIIDGDVCNNVHAAFFVHESLYNGTQEAQS